ncbi:MAG: SUMF1/EgtB/PvdO family nonheme iron enzyme [Chlamydiales bacterium]|nr:SUMF1/EgtB/PvdO family nonheme iron enzyme [Chlamydiales bacterium]
MQKEFMGDYKILKQIGQGPLGAVLLAEHRFIKKPYVLKILPYDLCQDRNFMQHFEQEVSRFAALEHPHLVRIHNVSFCEGTYFLVTDCVVDSIGETTNLAQYMSGRKERLREDELLSVAKQIAEVLDFVHSKNVFHGALTLNNILIGKGNPGIDVFISDLGLLKLVHPGGILAKTFQATADALSVFPTTASAGDERYKPTPVESEKLSKLTQAFLQSYAFLAPEQKKLLPMTAACDAYAYGTLLYYLITGTFPEGVFETIKALVPQYRFDWDVVIQGCLQRNPDNRPKQLLPLLEKTKMHTISVEAQPRRFPEPKTEAFQPQLQEAKPISVEAAAPRSIEAKREEAQSIQAIKEHLIPDEPVITEERVLQPVAALQPVIERTETPASPPPLENSVMVQKKDLSEATPVPITPPKDESYSKAISSMLNRDPVVTEYHPEHKESTNIEPLQTEMVVIPAGEYLRGSNEGNRDEAPQHKIFVDPFAIDVHPVTNEQFLRFLDYMGGEKDQNYNDIIRLKESRINRTGGRLLIESGYGKHPVVGVTWYGAVAYAKWAGKRLPTEAEWEIAARGGLEGAPYSTGENIEKNQANFFSSDTTSVRSYAPNAYGIYDMSGNVYEWCQDWYGYNYYESSEQEPSNPMGPLQGVYRVLRGGCWKSLKEDMRCSHRHRNNPGTVNGTYGFRCAANVR